MQIGTTLKAMCLAGLYFMGLIDKLQGKMKDAQIKVLGLQEKTSKNLVDKQTDALEKQHQYK